MIDFKKIDGEDFGDIRLYTLSTCGWCRRTKAFLKEHNVAYSYVDVDLLPDKDMDAAVAEQKKYNPRASYPTIVVDDNRTIIGFDEEALQSLLER